MKIIYGNEIEKIKEEVKNKAKFSKVMLLFDDFVSSAEIDEIYRAVKDDCIFNKLNLKQDLTEVFNGYKLLIFCCGTNAFLNCQLPLKDFTNIFLPTDCGMLPYFLIEGKTTDKDDLLILKPNTLDANVFCSLAFNKFYSYISGLFNTPNNNLNFDFSLTDITPNYAINLCQNLPQDLVFEDVKILAKTGIDYELLPAVDYVLINAFLVVFDAIKNNSLCLADFYKYDRENFAIIDKFYALANNNLLIKLVQYNFVSIINVLNKAKEKIEICLQGVPSSNFKNLSTIISKIKEYCKTDEGLFAYLYLYDIF
ncbi:MAG: hypothetical protein MJ152_00525 [Clostridia bacterium]|nr:hypothetical protein [Clostridia bacterium]